MGAYIRGNYERPQWHPCPGDKIREFMVLTFVWLDIIIPTCVCMSSSFSPGIGRIWSAVFHHGSLMEGEQLQLFLCPRISNAIDLKLELNLNLNQTIQRLMKIIVEAVKIAAKYNCDRCENSLSND